MERIQQVDDVAGVVVDRRERHPSLLLPWRIEAPKLRRHDMPAALRERELTFPHPGVDGKCVEQNEDAALPSLRTRHRFEIVEIS